MAFRTGNPALRETTFTNVAIGPSSNTMTIQGAVNKSFLMIILVVGFAIMSWTYMAQTLLPEKAMPFVIGCAIGGFILSLIIAFKATTAPVLGPIYAIVEGVFLGAISFFFESIYHGIVLQAVLLTFGIFISLLIVYKARIIPVTENFKLGVAAATGGIFMIYLINMILHFFGIGIPFIHESGWMGIGFSVFVIIVASLNLVLDFDFIEKGEEVGAPKYMEWYAAFGLVVTLIWLYIEILRLLAKLRER